MTDAVKDMDGIGPEDIERNGYDGQYVRTPTSPGSIRLEGGWFEVKRPSDAERFMIGPVSERAAPLKQAQRERWDASMAAASARGKLIQMQRVAERYGVPFAIPEDTSGVAPVEVSRVQQKRFEVARDVLIADIRAALRRRTWRLRAWLAVTVALIALAVWGSFAALASARADTPAPSVSPSGYGAEGVMRPDPVQPKEPQP